ncbi:ferredoxin [Alphaproteobacteria bacterium]|nr:ferredoxin [Alphaproteobacteria bacterium]
MVKALIDGIEVNAPAGSTILEAARSVQVNIPTLCYHPDLCATAACGICVVKLKNRPNMLRACCTPLEEGMDITTRDPDLVRARRGVLQLILSRHPNECLTCQRNGTCELQKLAGEFGIERNSFPCIVDETLARDDSTGAVVLDPRKCIACGRCVQVCQNVQNVWALCFLKRGINTVVSPAGRVKLAESPCIKCGQCSAHCPVGAITEFDQTKEVWEKLADPEAVCVVQVAPAVRVAIGEAFGGQPGDIDTGKLYAALRRLGFAKVFDTNFGADLTIMEEAHEFVARFANGTGALPLITSCCPAWVDFLEKYYPDMLGHFSSCKSPHEMLGVLAKTYWAEKNGVDPKKVYVVSIMPCTAKKYEVARNREDMFASGFQDVDVSLTTRELARMLKQAGIDFADLPDEGADAMLGEYSGAGTIFGRSGGVMEAALRTAYHMITGQNLADVDIVATQGTEGIRSFELDVAGKKVRIGIAHGTGNVETMLKNIKAALDVGQEPPYHFVEVMACTGGCVGGGGQPRGVTGQVRKARAGGLNSDDKKSANRLSHENAEIKRLYADYLGEPGGHKAHELLHTEYTPRKPYQR